MEEVIDNKGLVSILIPVYNVQKYIEKCARSLFEQTYKNIEYVFVDDSSPDDSIRIIKKILVEYPERVPYVRIIKHLENKGLASSRNTALDNCHGEYILHVDSDDYIEKDTVEKTYNAAIEKGADVVVFDFNLFDSQKKIPVYRDIGSSKQQYLKKLICHYINPVVWGKLIKRNLYIHNNIRAIPNLNHGEDYVVTSRLFYFAQKIIKLDVYLYNYRLDNTTSITNTNKTKKDIRNILLASDIVTEFYKKKEDYLVFKEYLGLGKLSIKRSVLKDNFFSYNNDKEFEEEFDRELFKNSTGLFTIRTHVFKFLIDRHIPFVTDVYSIILRFVLKVL